LIDVGKNVSKIPQFIRQTLSDFKDYLMNIKEAVEYITNEQKLGDDSKKCYDAKKTKPVDCYIHVYGQPQPEKKD